MRNRAFRRSAAIIVGSLIALAMPGAASATTFNITGWALDGSVGSYNGVVHAGSLTEASGIGRIVLTGTDMAMSAPVSLKVWCVDVAHNLANAQFTEVTSGTMPAFLSAMGYTATQLSYVSYLLAAHDNAPGGHADIVNATTSAAMQLAIWEVLNEASTTAWNVGSGNFFVTNYDADLGAGSPSVVSQANLWLGDLKTAITNRTVPTLNGTEFVVLNPGSGSQAQVFLRAAGVVPEPASWMTMILGFGAIGTALRRRRSAGRAVA